MAIREGRRAFSLVELLVVIGIIALLLSILLPTLTHVRRAVRATICLTHLQQLSASYQMYLSANRNHSFSMRTDITTLSWWEVLQPYNGNIQATMLCPQATEPGNEVGSAFLAWGPDRTYSVGEPQWVLRGTYIGSYGFNEWLYQQPTGSDPSLRKYFALPTHQSERVPVFGDCVESWAAADSSDTPPSNLINPAANGFMAYFCLDRHSHAVNIAFLDGHAERVKLEELWKLQWNTMFEPSEVKLPQ